VKCEDQNNFSKQNLQIILEGRSEFQDRMMMKSVLALNGPFTVLGIIISSGLGLFSSSLVPLLGFNGFLGITTIG